MLAKNIYVMGTVLLFLLSGCREDTAIAQNLNMAPVSTNRPSAAILVQPLGKVHKDVIQQAVHRLAGFNVPVKVLLEKPLPATAYDARRNRYQAQVLLDTLLLSAAPGEKIIGLTHFDICTEKNGISDWGIMGLGSPRGSCVASDKRVKDKRLFWKVVVHEFGHSCGLPHCPDPSCMMRAADGGDPTRGEKGFCTSCVSLFAQAGWVFDPEKFKTH